MTPAITSYYPIAVCLAIAAAVAIPLYLRGVWFTRGWAGVSVTVAGVDAVAEPLSDSRETASQARRLTAISGATGVPTGRVRPLARQPSPSRARAVESIETIASPSSGPPTLQLVARRPGLPKGSARIERRLAVVR